MPYGQFILVRVPGIIAVCTVAALVLGDAGPVFAQEAKSDSVQTRPRPEYDPIGFELDRLFSDTAAVFSGRPASDPEAPRSALSSFDVLPKLELETAYTDNLFLSDTDAQSDLIAKLRPSVRIVSDWDNHSLGFLAKGDIGRHKRAHRENYEDYKLELTGAVRIDEFDSIDVLVNSEHSHDQRGTIDDPGSGFGPTFNDTYKFSANYEHRVPDGFLLRPHIGISRYRYENNGSIDNSDRWRDDYEYLLRLGYEFIPGTTLFVQPRYTALSYRQRTDRNGLIRDTQLLEFLAGVTWDASAVTFLEASVGVLGARFDEPTFKDAAQPTAHLEMTWNMTPLITVTSGLTRAFTPTAQAGLAGTVVTSFEGSVDWEARYNMILGVGYGRQNEDFIDSVPARKRDTNRFDLKGRWLINEYFFALAQLSHMARTGDLPSDELQENRAALTLGAQL
jgi:hypothetical protein